MPHEALEPKLTFGQKGIRFNHAKGEVFNEVDTAKENCAILIDQMNDLRNNSESSEQKRLASIAITELQSAQMWAVKAITWQD
jgi:hypothetical protein